VIACHFLQRGWGIIGRGSSQIVKHVTGLLKGRHYDCICKFTWFCEKSSECFSLSVFVRQEK
jgi:hypothetical protein